MYLTFAWRYFKAKKSANAINIISWVTAGVITFAIACQILVLSVFNGFEGLVKSLYGSFYADIKVLPARGKTITLSHAQIARLRQQQGVQNISLIAEEKAILQNEDLQTSIFLKGVDTNYTNVTGLATKTYIGKFDPGTIENPGLIVGAGIQNAAGVSVDGAFEASTLTLILPKKGKVSVSDPEKSISEGKVKAAGVFSLQQDFDNKYAITNIGFVKQQMGFAADEYSAAEIKLTNKTDVEKTAVSLSVILGKNYTVQTKYQQNTSLYTTMRLEKWIIYAVLTLILFIAAFNIVSALTMLVLEKQKDISVLQSMGANRSIVLKIFLSEGLLLAGIGVVSGTLLALLTCYLQIHFKIIKLQGGSFLIDYFPVKLQGSDFLLVGCTAFSIVFLASWFPAKKAAAQSIGLK